MAERDEWIALRDTNGKLQARYNPRTRKLLIGERRQTTEHDLSRYHKDNAPRQPYLQRENIMLE